VTLPTFSWNFDVNQGVLYLDRISYNSLTTPYQTYINVVVAASRIQQIDTIVTFVLILPFLAITILALF